MAGSDSDFIHKARPSLLSVLAEEANCDRCSHGGKQVYVLGKEK